MSSKFFIGIAIGYANRGGSLPTPDGSPERSGYRSALYTPPHLGLTDHGTANCSVVWLGAALGALADQSLDWSRPADPDDLLFLATVAHLHQCTPARRDDCRGTTKMCPVQLPGMPADI